MRLKVSFFEFKEEIIMSFPLFIAFFIGSTLLHASQDFDRQQIEERIKPVGQVNIEEQAASSEKKNPNSSNEDKKNKKEESKEKTSGQAVYERYCVICHQSGVAGAPKFRVADDWKARLEAKKLEGLIASALKGLNAMPPKGTCVECEEEDIKQAIQYMLPSS